MDQSNTQSQAYQFDVCTQTGKEMVALGGWRSRRRFFERGILLERFVIDLDARPFLIELPQAVVRKRQIARHQIEDAHRSVFVCEDLFGQLQWKIHSFEPNPDGR